MKLEISFWLSLLVFTAATGGTFATDPVLGSTCTVTANCSAVANSRCRQIDDGPSTCTCEDGYKESGSSCSRIALYDACLRGKPDCNHLSHAACRPDPKSTMTMKCLCDVKYKYNPSHDRCENRLIQIRLANGHQLYNGRVEIRYNGMWGTASSDNFGESEARVFCTAMGMSGGVVKGSTYGPGSVDSTVWINGISCVGTEDSPEDCKHGEFGNCVDCGHEKDISIECDSITTQDMYRLAGGSTPYIGRIELFWNGQWGTVCNDHFSAIDAKVFCRTLGFIGGHIISHGDTGTGKIWLDNVKCKENDRYLHNCEHDGFGEHNCDHQEDVSVECTPLYEDTPSDGSQSSFKPTNGTIFLWTCNEIPNQPVQKRICYSRLRGGKSELQGVLEVWHNGSWGPVCVNYNEDFHNASTVVCRSLGFAGGKVYREAKYDRGGGPKMGNVVCSGTENKIQDCQHKGSDELPSHCTLLGDRIDIAIECEHSAYTKVLWRLADGPKGNEAFEGRVELGINGEWGAVCETGWDETSVTALCEKLGQYGGTIVRTAKYGLGSGRIWQSAGKCKRDDSTLLECGWNISLCRHEDELNIQCLPERPENVKYQLMDFWKNTPVEDKGILEVFYNGEWGVICAKKFFEADMRVACRSVGFESTKQKVYDTTRVSRMAWMADIKCKGDETALHKCSFAGWGKATECDRIIFLDCDR